uniref:Uncharacterized protein n=1 Tax=Desulfovibrio sp. U5L TaxID=596152 RepID=I2Q7K6_9BACT
MLAMVPIYPSASESFWLSAHGLAALRDFLREIRETPGLDEALVCCERSEIVALARELGLAVVPLPTPPEAEPSLIPPGAEACLEAARQVYWRGHDRLLIPNFRLPLLNRELLEEAAVRFAVSGAKVLLGVGRATDHPCQFLRLFQVRRQGMLHFLDPQASTGGLVMSRPFVRDWPSGELAVPGLTPWGEREARAVFTADRLEQAEARALARGPHAGLAGLELWPESPNFEIVAVRESGSRRLGLRLCGPEQDRPLTLEGCLIFAETGVRTMLADLPGPEAVNCIDLGEMDETPVAFVWALLEETHDGGVDLVLPCAYGGHLWRADSHDTLVDVATGRPIVGRQDFPEVYEADRSLVIVSRLAPPDVLAHLPDGAILHAWPEGSGGLVRTSQELVLCRLLRETAGLQEDR